MSYRQTKTPNLDPYIYQNGKVLNSWLGWCLAYVQTAFGAGWSGGSAREGWDNSAGKHENMNIPSGVYVPIWFHHYGTYSGIYKNWGHVAIWKDGKIWTSPYTNKPYADTFNDINALCKMYNCTYIGWTEFVGPTRVIEAVAAATPAPLAPHQRTVGSTGANYRVAPDKNSQLIKEFKSGNVLDFKGFVRGTDPYGNGNNVWFVGLYTGGYIYSGACTDSSTNGLSDLTATPLPPPVVTPPVVPEPPAYKFTKDLDCVTEVIPAHANNFKYGNFPAKPAKAVIHDFGTLGTDTYGSAVNWFKSPNSEVSAHFVISGKKITQMVSLSDRAYHAGVGGNDFVGIETDPAQDADTIASTRAVLEQLKAKYGYQLELIEHNQVPGAKTACGDDVDLANYDITPPRIGEITMTPITPVQWKSVLTNSLMAFLAAFIPVILASGSIDTASLTAAGVAGLMAGLKILQKLFTKDA
jgi:hypothetical protein